MALAVCQRWDAGSHFEVGQRACVSTGCPRQHSQLLEGTTGMGGLQGGGGAKADEGDTRASHLSVAHEVRCLAVCRQQTHFLA